MWPSVSRWIRRPSRIENVEIPASVGPNDATDGSAAMPATSISTGRWPMFIRMAPSGRIARSLAVTTSRAAVTVAMMSAEARASSRSGTMKPSHMASMRSTGSRSRTLTYAWARWKLIATPLPTLP